MEFKRVNTGALWEAKVGYCRAIRNGTHVFLSGTAPVGEDGKTVAPGNAYLQAKRCFEIAKSALTQLDCPMSAVVRTRMFVTDISRWGEYGSAHQEYFGAHPPATSMVEVKALIDPTMLIEVEVDAIVTESLRAEPVARLDQEFHEGAYTVSTDKSRLKADTVHGFLKRSHWAPNRKFITVTKSIDNSLCYGIYTNKEQVGFARIVTDYCTYAYLCDVFVDEAHRGKGLSKWLMTCIIKNPDLQNLRRFALATKDAHDLYRKFGFVMADAQKFMEILNDEV